MVRTPRRIDHIVVAVRDLDAAGAFFERLGFQVGARNRHPWGTENRLIQFDTSFIELISIGRGADAAHGPEEGRFSFGGFVRNYLRVRQGLAMLALDSQDAEADAAQFDRDAIGSLEPFHFERRGRRPDGSATRVAFTLAFAIDPEASEAGFFVCQQHFPENFWDASFQRHENGARGIAAVGLTAAAPAAHEGFLVAFSGSAAKPGPNGSLSIELVGGRLIVDPDTSGRGDLRLQSVAVRIPDPARQAERLRRAGVPFVAEQGGLRIPADAALGLEIRFGPEGAR